MDNNQPKMTTSQIGFANQHTVFRVLIACHKYVRAREGLDVEEIGKYLRINLSTEYIEEQGLADLLPKKKKKKRKKKEKANMKKIKGRQWK